MFTASNLACNRGQFRILSDVSFSLNPGDCLILRGPNGSGKTTLLRTLAGLSPASAGTVSIASEDVVYSGHLDAIKPQLTVDENLAFWRSIYRAAATQTHALFNLTDLAHRHAATLSAGQKRRLGLARLHISGRKIWLLDEPTTALDAAHVTAFTEILQSHCASGGIAVVSTHLDLALPTAKTLDIAQFAARAMPQSDPFLDGVF